MTQLYLIPAPLSEDQKDWQLYQPAGFEKVLLSLQGLFAETPKIARSFIGEVLKKAGRQLQDFPIYELSEHTSLKDVEGYAEMIAKSKGDWGVVSDAGLVLFADPGRELIELSKKKGIEVKTLGGTSSIVSALQLSGKQGQQMIFHGYFPKEKDKLKELIRLFSEFQSYTHLFIETPYRNQKQLEALLSLDDPKLSRAFLGVYIALFSGKEERLEMNIQEWKKWKGELPKEPAVFVLSFS